MKIIELKYKLRGISAIYVLSPSGIECGFMWKGSILPLIEMLRELK